MLIYTHIYCNFTLRHYIRKIGGEMLYKETKACLPTEISMQHRAMLVKNVVVWLHGLIQAIKHISF